jgi:hypothetical protein
MNCVNALFSKENLELIKKDTLNDRIKYSIFSTKAPIKNDVKFLKNNIYKIWGFHLKQLKQFVNLKTISLQNLGQYTVFKAELKKELQDGARYPWQTYILLPCEYDKKNNFIYSITMQEIDYLQLQENTDQYYLSGEYVNREGRSKYYVLDLSPKRVKIKFMTQEDVYMNECSECASYVGNDHELKLSKKDINSDGYLDLLFTGTKHYYCVGGEMNCAMDKVKPVFREKIYNEYIYNTKKQTWIKKRRKHKTLIYNRDKMIWKKKIVY